ncbi:MAG: endonuclease/exonuclease/phosphatase family protein [Micromonosporaceae bacterium]|nr:endonuclease/exonuclease/phosphatase family protein [Micromonosporaceae bacterium]
MRFRTPLAVVLATVLLTLVGAVPAQAATTNQTYRVWQWNVAGASMHNASTTDNLIPLLTGSVTSRNADFVGLNELCRQQYNAIVDSLRAAGWPQDSSNFARFEVAHPTACNGAGEGIAIFSRMALGSADRYDLAEDPGYVERRKLLCAPLAARPSMRFCVTHTSPWSYDVSAQQLTEVKQHLEDYEAGGGTVIIAGDLNVHPHYGRLDDWYSSSLDVPNNSRNTGSYRELDDADSANCLGYGEQTTENNTSGLCGQSSKIDFIFARENHIVGAYDADSLGISQGCTIGACSDHRILVGTVTLTVAS